MFWSVFGGILIAAFGVFIFVKPDMLWKLTEQWKSYRADEPSDFYIISTKFGGVMFGIVGLAMAVLPLILE